MSSPITPTTCFAASNSASGFCNYYDRLFTATHPDYLYIIKGGPGTGKSHFMKMVARHARTLGYTVTEYLCSSDPHSLDGLLLTAKGLPSLGFLDGTAPHGRDPSLPGVREELLDLGRFWRGSELRVRREEIAKLSEAKSAEYAAAYRYLRAAGEADGVLDALLTPCVRRDALDALAERLLRDQPDGGEHQAIPALRRAISMKGSVTLSSFEEAAMTSGGRLIIAEDHPTRGGSGIAAQLTDRLLSISRRRGLLVYVSYDPLIPHKIDGLYYPHTGLCILSGFGQGSGDCLCPHTEALENLPLRHLHLRRYLDSERLRTVRSEMRRAMSLRQSLLEAAEARLTHAAAHHFALEEIYASAMDFRVKEAFTEEFCKEALKR